MKKNNVKKYAIILVIFTSLFSVDKTSCGQTWTQAQNKIIENTQQIENINGRIIDLKDSYRLLYDGAKNQNDQLSNQISFASYLLGGISLIITFGGIFLAWYINRQYEKIREMKDVVEATKKVIDSHATDLYIKLKREETLSLLERLRDVPEDITNICQLLLSRDLLNTDFSCLKEAYLKIKKVIPIDGEVKGNYVTLFMQHFAYESLKDQDLRDEIISNINAQNLHNMFARDIKNFFDQSLKYLSEFGIDNDQSTRIIKNLFFNYSKSKFQTNIEMQNYIKERLSECKLKTDKVASIAKEQAMTDSVYVTWVDSIFI